VAALPVSGEPTTAEGCEAVDPAAFRAALGHFCTGVTVVTAAGTEGPAGFACQAFAAVSLEPPLVLFCPTRSSRSWPVIERAGTFCVNVLAREQVAASALFGSRRADKFDAVAWSPSPGGAPVIDGVLTWIECTIEAVHEAGDHFIVVGRVVALGGSSDRRPLLFHRGRYTVTAADLDRDPDGVALAAADGRPEPWFTWSRPDDWI
jgi:3-hydroxy-9,10-secoandrosta-1,3,5(10)-triene-9,17-dione monooxygenase reductase component